MRISFLLPVLALDLECLATPRMLIWMILQLPDFLGRQGLFEAMPAHLTIRSAIILLASFTENKPFVKGKMTSPAQGNCSFERLVLFIRKRVFGLRVMNYKLLSRATPST